MSLAGAGQSPQSFTASAVSADGAIYSPISKSQTCAPLPSGNQMPSGNQTPPGVIHPSKQNAVLRNSGQGTMSLAGAGQSPQSFTASAVSADGAIYSPISKSQTCAPLPPGNQTPPGVTHPSKQNAVLRLTAQRSTRLCRATFPPRTHPAARRSAPTAPRALPSKIPHALCNPPWFFARQIPAPPVFPVKKILQLFCFKDLTAPFSL